MLPRARLTDAHPRTDPLAHHSLLLDAFHTRMAAGLDAAGRTATAEEETRAACIFEEEFGGGRGEKGV